MADEYSVFVNTTDCFEDCWYPFFKLFHKYWPSCKYPVYLNTETKTYTFKELDVVCIKNSFNQHKSKTWSECLLQALDKIENDIILYLHEDYFIKAPIDAEKIHYLYVLMINENMDCIQLTPFASPGPYKKCAYEGLLELGPKANYRISTQASLWRKEVIKSYLRKHENPWQFEVYGTKRAHRKNHKIYIIDGSLYKEGINEIIPYTPTGIVKGKWNKDAVVDLFHKNHIDIDYNIRGCYDKNAKKKYLPRVSIKKIISRLKSI